MHYAGNTVCACIDVRCRRALEHTSVSICGTKICNISMFHVYIILKISSAIISSADSDPGAHRGGYEQLLAVPGDSGNA